MREYNIAELKNLIREAYLEVLTENAESSNRKKARRLLKDKKYVTRDNFKAGDEEERIVINTLPDCVRYNHFKFAIFFYSLYYQYKDKVKVKKNADEQNNKEKNDWEIINNYFFNILKEEGDNFDYTRYLTNKNDYTLIPLNELFVIIEEYNSNKEEDNKGYNTTEYPYNGYKIVKITSFIQSQEYSKYSNWCITKSKNLYDDYKDSILDCFYYCLRYDYKDTNERLSMLAILVNEDGDLMQVTTRANDGDFYYKTEKEVEKHFGIDNFSSVFKPITKKELKQAQKEEERIKTDYRKNIKQYLKQGHNIEDILRKAYDEFDYDKGLDLFSIKDKNKENYIDKQGNLLFNEWYDYIYYDEDINLFKVNNNKQNYIDKQGNLLFNEWYDLIWHNNRSHLFYVNNNNKYNYIDIEGNLLSNEWFDEIEYSEYIDLFKVENNFRYNYIDKEGNLLSNEWFDEIEYSEYIDLFKVRNNTKNNLIDRNGNLLFNEWYDRIWYSKSLKLFEIKNNNKNNYIDIEGNLLFKQWYDWFSFDETMNLFSVVNDNKIYTIDINENIVE